ncbi:hypothetical protein [Oceanobacillus chungangensis]|uniref:hypothetical protein n=1 Tax=Oceanobacillus chungangensis TaxID=1229152 RepID=UPI001B8678A9|nr:hypothetical protein [Oceanobacillus chungangensis]
MSLLKRRALTISLFVSKWEKVIKAMITRNIVQKKLGLASIQTTNRGRPVRKTVMNDVPVELAHSFFQWYAGRKSEVKIEYNEEHVLD